MATVVIREKYAETKTNIDDEKRRIMTMAANLVKAEIREEHYSVYVYPNSNQIKQLNWIPKSLKGFMQQFRSSSIKQESIGQSIVKNCLPEICYPATSLWYWYWARSYVWFDVGNWRAL